MSVPPSPSRFGGRSRLPLLIWFAALGLAFIQLWMVASTLDQPTPGLWGVRGWEMVIGLSFASVGALIAARRPEHAVGRLMLSVGLAAAALGVVNWYPVLSDARPVPLPLVEVVRWLTAWLWAPFGLLAMAVLPLIFPDGHLPSRRWRPALLLVLVAVVAFVAGVIAVIKPIGALEPAPLAAVPTGQTWPTLISGFALFAAAAVTAGTSLVYRYRHADEMQRQQIKWVAYAVAVLIPTIVIGLTGNVIASLLELAALVGVVVAIAIAVLHYRLYEIDEIINRTLVYGFLTAILAGVYTASITLTQKAFQAITNERSDASIVLTTLIVVSLFTPLRARLQSVVDKRLRTVEPLAKSTDPGQNVLDTLTQLDGLRSAGIVTQAEFDAKKAELLARL